MDRSKLISVLVIPLAMLALFALAQVRPSYFNDFSMLQALLGAQVLAVLVWHYDKLFLPALWIVFLWAGSALPFAGMGNIGRWVLLLAGSSVGLLKWIQRDDRKPMGPFHLFAALFFMGAAASSLVSNVPTVSFLKSASFFLLFLYAATGARVCLLHREFRFVLALARSFEYFTYLTGLAYAAGFQFFGNPNSMGAVLSVAVFPVLLWAGIEEPEPKNRLRWRVAILSSMLLVVLSGSRAAMLALFLSGMLLVACLRRYKIMFQGGFAVLLIATTIAVVSPRSYDALSESTTENLVYKGHRSEGLLGSRATPWEETKKVIRQSPWFGSGFGTDIVDTRNLDGGPQFSSSNDVAREHGSSYLAALQYLGILGGIPFALLICMILFYISRVCKLAYQTGNASTPALPLACVCLAGLVHAGFEDWLVAAGYYLTTFFWVCAFLLVDFQGILPQSVPVPQNTPPPLLVPVEH